MSGLLARDLRAFRGDAQGQRPALLSEARQRYELASLRAMTFHRDAELE